MNHLLMSSSTGRVRRNQLASPEYANHPRPRRYGRLPAVRRREPGDRARHDLLAGLPGESVVNMRGRSIFRVLAVVLLSGMASLGVSCSGAEQTATTNARFPNSITDKVNAACRARQKAYDGRPRFPVDGFDPRNPDPSRLPEVGAYFEGANWVYQQFIDRLAAIDPPAQQSAQLAAFLAASRADFRLAKDQQVAAKAKDVKAFSASLPKIDAVAEDLQKKARALGAADCVTG
jgi:hypothetical protein